jgi:hypothetical protein
MSKIMFKVFIQVPLYKMSFSALLMMTLNTANAHSGHLNEKALKVCQEKQRSDACQFEGGHNDLYIGTCQYMVEILTCVRSQPIQYIDSIKTPAPTK